ncbi:MAG: hypothetical protein P4L85_15415 [Paludisphaera borealis]|uniref:hypothetical protein n=1 Tax=Paludisphaera borealis TaxID=1387353 RepID=UPI002840882A|nr:hypothetical protein [Paludisphaera borealis]MDR3620740.1 hypothetical protein [Paludisphaera borealis]
MRIAYALSLVVLAALFGSSAEARAQAARRGPYYSRTATTRGHAGMAPERGAGSLETTAAVSAANYDPLRPYSSHPSDASTRYSSEPQVAPTPRPQQRPIARNYYPTARIGQSANLNVGAGRRHCTPSRAGSLGR